MEIPTSRQETETELTLLQRFSRGFLRNNFYTLIPLKFANVYVLLAATARRVRANNQTAGENSSRRSNSRKRTRVTCNEQISTKPVLL